ncbi:MAG: hypothetical protein HPZ91_16145 [Lentisphaeria bacterium]|nr:hypothetical protein [Lentisphaeria bacterium]
MDNRALSSELVAAELRDAIRRSRRVALRATVGKSREYRKLRLPEIQLARLIVTVEELADRLEEA